MRRMKRFWLVAICACSQNDEPPKRELTAPQAQLMETVARGVFEAPRYGSGATSPPPAPTGGITQKMFADDVAAGQLPLSISIETIGGVATVIIPRGTKLPVARTEVFSTATDNQDRVEVHLLQGERPLVTHNRSLGKFQLFGIPPAPRGVPQIEVTFAVDKDGVLGVRARDKATDRVQAITIESAAALIDKAAVDEIVAEAQAAKATDDAAIALATARNELETLIYADKNLLADVGHKMSPALRSRFEREIKGAESVLRTATRPGDLKLVLAVKESLGKTGHRVATELYENAK
jgi:molecular chaperone DnaK